jgi:hypothetical protein
VRRNKSGTWASIPEARDVDDCRTIEQLYAWVGPGSYELRGFDSRGKIVRKERIAVEAKPEDEQEELAEEEPKNQYIPPAPPADSGGGGFERLLVAMSAQTTNLMGAMFAAQGQQTAAMMNLLGVVLAPRNDGNQMVELLAKVLDSKQTSGDPQQTFLAGAKMVMEIQEGKKEAEKAEENTIGGIGELMGVVSQGMQMVNAIKGTPPMGASDAVVEAAGSVVG